MLFTLIVLFHTPHFLEIMCYILYRYNFVCTSNLVHLSLTIAIIYGEECEL
jgi:hypothetical protein